MAKEQGVYVISLDAIDLSLLPINRISGHDTIAPLWSNTKKEEYYEFKINTVESKDTCEGQSPNLEFESAFCHICDLEVPKPFLSEHTVSLKHKTNMRIAVIALQRISKNLNSIHESVDHVMGNSVYFCPTCVTVIDTKCKDIHEKSISHKNSLAVDKILNDFLILYEGNKTYDIENKIHKRDQADDVESKTPYSNETDLHDLMRKLVDPSLKLSDNFSNKLLQAIENPMPNKQSNETKNTTTKTEGSVKLSLHDFISLYVYDRCKENRMHLKVTEEDVVEIGTVDGSVVRATDAYFHGFSKMGKKQYHCFICKEIFTKRKQIEQHKFNEKHLERICLQLKDKNCVRQIADDFCHCVICNKTVECADLHILCDKEHSTRLKQALISDKLKDDNGLETKENQSKAEDSIKSNSGEMTDVLHRKEQKSTFTVDLEKHTDVIPLKEVDTEKSNKYKSSEHELHSSELDDETDLLVPASTHVGKNQANEFVKERSLPETPLNKHDNNVETRLKITKSSLDRMNQSVTIENKFFCCNCNCYVSTRRRGKHNNTLKHTFNIQSDFHYIMQQTGSDEIVCRVCDSHVANNVKDVTEHVADINHINKYKHLLVYNRIYKINEFEFYCELCEEYLIIKNELLHIKSRKHLLNCDLGDVDDINKIVPYVSDDEDDEIFEMIYNGVSDKSTTGELTRDEGKSKEVTESKATEDVIDTGPQPSHEGKIIVANKSHASEDGINTIPVELRMSDDGNDKVTTSASSDDGNDKEGNGYHFCNTCQVKVPKHDSNIQEHERGKAHTNKLAKLTVNTKAISEEIISDYDYVMEQSDFPGVISCGVCKLHVINNKDHISLHLNDARHLYNYATLLRDNHLIQTSNNIQCNLCAVNVGIRSEIIHVRGKKHIKNLEEELLRSKTAPLFSDVVKVNADDEVNKNSAKEDSQTSNIPCTNNNQITIDNSRNIKPSMLALLEPTDNENIVICKICRVHIPFCEYNVRTHINGTKHNAVCNSLLKGVN